MDSNAPKGKQNLFGVCNVLQWRARGAAIPGRSKQRIFRMRRKIAHGSNDFPLPRLHGPKGQWKLASHEVAGMVEKRSPS
jgi:hypothetical protein